MTAANKAQELFTLYRFLLSLPGAPLGDEKDGIAIQCALAAVNTVLEELPEMPQHLYVDRNQYWKDVKANLENQQKNCSHTWSEPKYDPEAYKEHRIDFSRPGESHGSDYYPATYWADTSRARWSRTCTKCGKKEYTYQQETVEVIRKPKF